MLKCVLAKVCVSWIIKMYLCYIFASRIRRNFFSLSILRKKCYRMLNFYLYIKKFKLFYKKEKNNKTKWTMNEWNVLKNIQNMYQNCLQKCDIPNHVISVERFWNVFVKLCCFECSGNELLKFIKKIYIIFSIK